MTLWLTTLALLAVTDIAFGLAYAYITRKLNSTIARIGMIRKSAMFILVGVGYVVTTPLQPYINFHLGELLAVFFCLSELLSVLRYAALLGVPLPKRLRSALEEVTQSLSESNGRCDDEDHGSGSSGGRDRGVWFAAVRFLLRPLCFIPRL